MPALLDRTALDPGEQGIEAHGEVQGNDDSPDQDNPTAPHEAQQRHSERCFAQDGGQDLESATDTPEIANCGQILRRDVFHMASIAEVVGDGAEDGGHEQRGLEPVGQVSFLWHRAELGGVRSVPRPASRWRHPTTAFPHGSACRRAAGRGTGRRGPAVPIPTCPYRARGCRRSASFTAAVVPGGDESKRREHPEIRNGWDRCR